MVRLSVVRCVTIAESVEMPLMEGIIVDAYVDRHENQEKEKEGRLLVELHPNLPERYVCVLAPMIVDSANSTTVPVCIFNPHNYLVVVMQDSVVGQVELVDVVTTITRYKNSNEKGNFPVTGQMLLKKKSLLLNKASRLTKG